MPSQKWPDVGIVCHIRQGKLMADVILNEKTMRVQVDRIQAADDGDVPPEARPE